MNDLISRQAAINAFWSLDVELRPSTIDAILNTLNGLPSAQPEITKRTAETEQNVPNDELISKKAAIEVADAVWTVTGDKNVAKVWDQIRNLPSVQGWVPVTERPPEELKAVNITWVNHEPEPYYHDIKDRNFVATGIYFHGHWYWYSTVCADYLREYGKWDVDMVDDAVEIIAWMPLPEPYKERTDEHR